ncbi:ATP-binding protein [Amycolatopsis sp. NPDC001319]|uniref:ATP-binding protein n=1 Tax=unclassified Amycolatopsis TaxID=2618356 RepID=UPI0036A64FE9
MLVTGMSGVGRSALLAELASRGFVTVSRRLILRPVHLDGERLWRSDVMAEVLGSSSSQFVSGTVRNPARFRRLFSHVVLLSAPASVLVERLASRTSNPYGTDPAELAETLGYLETVEPLLRASATLEVVTTVPAGEVADLVLAHAL